MSFSRKKPRFRRTKERSNDDPKAAGTGMGPGVRAALRRAGLKIDDAPDRQRQQAISAVHFSAENPLGKPVASQPVFPAQRGVNNLPDIAASQPFPDVQFFALVSLTDPGQVHYYGVDVGTSACTFSCNPSNGRTNFGHWNSMQSAFDRLNKFAGPDSQLALMVFDSVPVFALSALGLHVPQALAGPTLPAIESAP